MHNAAVNIHIFYLLIIITSNNIIYNMKYFKSIFNNVEIISSINLNKKECKNLSDLKKTIK